MMYLDYIQSEKGSTRSLGERSIEALWIRRDGAWVNLTANASAINSGTVPMDDVDSDDSDVGCSSRNRLTHFRLLWNIIQFHFNRHPKACATSTFNINHHLYII